MVYSVRGENKVKGGECETSQTITNQNSRQVYFTSVIGFSYQHVLLLLSSPCLCLFTALYSIWTVGRVSVGLFKHYSLGVNEELTSYQHHWETGGLKNV